MIALTPEAAERGYNNRAAVPDHPRWLARCAELSAAAMASLAPRRDVRYGPNPKETLDLFLPATPARGTLAFIHGGYWRTLDKADFAFVATPFVAQGYAVANINYDLCPAVTLATIVDECRRAVAWLAREGSRNGAPAPLVLAGHSAGGHLVAMMYATDWRALGLPAEPFAGGVSLSGVHDLAPLLATTINADLRLTPADTQGLSPVNLAPTVAVPLFVAVGADETSEFVRQSHLLFEAWPARRPRGAPAALEIPGRHHFNVVADYADGEAEITRRTLALFAPPAVDN